MRGNKMVFWKKDGENYITGTRINPNITGATSTMIPVEKESEEWDLKKTKFIFQQLSKGGFQLEINFNQTLMYRYETEVLQGVLKKFDWREPSGFGLGSNSLVYGFTCKVKDEEEAKRIKKAFLKNFKVKKLIRKQI